MKRLVLACALLAGMAARAGAADVPAPASPEPALSEQLLREQKHFLECLAVVYHPAFWISYNGALYFQTKDAAQLRQLDAMKAARAGYTIFTSLKARHALAAEALAESGVTEPWRRKILLPFSETNPNVTPTLPKNFVLLSRYKVLRELGGGDALLQDGDTVVFVMGFGHGVTDGSGTNACLMREGTKTYTAADGQKQTVGAFTDVGLSREEIAALVQASAGFRKKADSVNQQLASFGAHEQFAETLARANDRNPSVQYEVATGYLEGKGTTKDPRAGLEWMRRAARNGSGEAKAYLEKLGLEGK